MRTPRGRRSGWLLILALVGVLLLGVEAGARPARAATLVVTTTADSGPGSLRDAIETANSTPGPDTITFNIPGSGVQTIQPLSALPTITDPVVIDGSSQPGYSDSPLIELSGTSAGNTASGLTITGGGSTVRALTINRFQKYGMWISGAGGNAVEGCFIGTTADSLAPAGNGEGGLYVGLPNAYAGGSPNNRVGGTAPGTRNVISGNRMRDIGLYGNGTSGTVIQGNYIGLDRLGQAAVWAPATFVIGIDIIGAPSTVVGGTTEATRNVIAGHPSAQITVVDGQGTTIQGNYFNTGSDGTSAVVNGGTVILVQRSSNVLIGGMQTGARNVIAGRGESPLPSGTAMGWAVKVEGGSNLTLAGNYIGTAADGRTIRPFSLEAVVLSGVTDAMIGGTALGSGNLINGFSIAGIGVDTGFPVPTRSSTAVIQGNRIGVDVDGAVVPRPNDNYTAGIMTTLPSEVQIGGTTPGAGNVIASPGSAGVVFSANGRMPILGNAIYGTSKLSIDGRNSPSFGPNANDPSDSDGIQNYPAITSVGARNGQMTVAGTLDSTPSTTFRVELFAGMTDPPSGRGEARRFLGAVDVTTDGSGIGRFATTLPVVAADEAVSATATGPTSGTSEVSPPAVPMPASILVTPTTGLRTTEAGGTATFTVALATAPSSNVVVPLASSNVLEGTVSPAALTFSPANAALPQTVTVRGVDDTIVDGPQSFTVLVGPAQSADPTYAGLDPSDVAVTNDDNDVLAVCSPRPQIQVSTTRTSPGQLTVTVRASSNAQTPNNRLAELRFHGPAGTLVDVSGIVGRSGTFTQALADRPSSVTFVVRAGASGPVTLPFDVVDSCGPWPTFVGDGGR